MRPEERLPAQRGKQMIRFKVKGNYKKAFSWMERLLQYFKRGGLNKFGERGVKALSAATPKDTGKTADSWEYAITYDREKASIVWSNTNVNDGVNIAVILQYGHGTGNGGYVEGRDYINPAMRSVFDSIANDAWREMMRV